MNSFREKLQARKKLCGLWLGSASAYMAEISAQSEYDWYLIDGEHAPNTISTIAKQLSALDLYGATSIVRILNKDEALIKQVLDLGAKNLLIPMVNNADEAEKLIKSSKYPPLGTRGVGGYIIRATKWGKDKDYLQNANKDNFIILQCESKEGLDNLESILKLDCLDSVFIGPADLSINLGFESMNDDAFKKIWFEALRMIKSYNKFAGTLALDVKLARECFNQGADYIGVAVDVISYLDSLNKNLSNYRNFEKDNA